MVGGRQVSLHAAKHVGPVVALALGLSVHEEPDAADEGRTLGADGGAQRCVARAVQRTAHTQMCSVNREDCDERGISLLRNLSARWVLEELSAQGRRRCYKGKKGGMGAKTETTVCRTQTNGRPPPPNRLLKRRGFESSDGGPLDSSCSFNTILRYSYQKMKTPRSARTPKGDERLLVTHYYFDLSFKK